jgi:phage terminase small subunit
VSDEQAELSVSELLGALTHKQRRWCLAYVGEARGNGVRACEIAGYSGTRETLAVVACENLRKPNIRSVLEAIQESDPLVPTAVERLQQIGKIARGEMPEWKAITAGDMAGQLIKMPTSPQMILAANVELGKLAGAYVTKVAQTDGKGEDLSTMPLEEVLALAALGKP